MSETEGMAIPLPDEEGVVAGRRRSYVAQLLDDMRTRLIALLSRITFSLVLDWFVSVLSGFMIAIPFYVFIDNLHQGVLFLSPPLFFMFLGGVTGWLLPPRGKSLEESVYSSGDPQ